MHPKNGFTVVELIVSFALTMTIAAFLFQIILSLRSLYISSGIKTELLTRQSLFHDKINRSLENKTLRTVTVCGDTCFIFGYTDGTSEQFIYTNSDHTLAFGNYKVTLTDGSVVGKIDIRIVRPEVTDQNHKNAFLSIQVPITNPLFDDQSFNLSVVYQFSTYGNNVLVV